MEKTYMKKCLFIFLLIGLLAAFGGSVAYADPAPVLTIGSDCDASPDELVEIPVEVSDVNDLAMVQFALCYDSEALEYAGFRNGSLLPEGEALTVNSEIAGKIFFVWDSTVSLSGSGELAVFSFRVRSATSGKADIRIDEEEEIVFASSSFQRINPGFVSGHIVIFDSFFPVDLSTIGEEAFAGTALRCIRLSDKISKIGPRAFVECAELAYIILPADPEIDDTAFEGLTGLTIIGISGSRAESAARDGGFTFMAISA